MGIDSLPNKIEVGPHNRCFACGQGNEHGLKLKFYSLGMGAVETECVINEEYEGYPGIVQGGIISTMLDCAMTNCLFSIGIEAMTARLDTRFSEPVFTGIKLTVSARMIRRRGRVFELEAAITQGGAVAASAIGRFVVPKDAL